MAVQEYTVKGGDTLGKIAEQLLGSGAKWEKIYEANRESVKNPNYILHWPEAKHPGRRISKPAKSPV